MNKITISVRFESEFPKQNQNTQFTLFDAAIMHIDCWDGPIYNMRYALERASDSIRLNRCGTPVLPPEPLTDLDNLEADILAYEDQAVLRYDTRELAQFLLNEGYTRGEPLEEPELTYPD